MLRKTKHFYHLELMICYLFICIMALQTGLGPWLCKPLDIVRCLAIVHGAVRRPIPSLKSLVSNF